MHTKSPSVDENLMKIHTTGCFSNFLFEQGLESHLHIFVKYSFSQQLWQIYDLFNLSVELECLLVI